MKITKNQFCYAITSICILVASVTFLILNFLLFPDFWIHPILNFFFVLFIGFGIVSLVKAFACKAPIYFFLASLLLGLSIFYVCFIYLNGIWWICLIVLVVFMLIISITSFIMAGNKTEAIALNKDPEYKNYEQRKAEKEAEEANKPKEELPEIKSFKD